MRCGCTAITVMVLSFVLFMVGIFFVTEIPPLQSLMETLHCRSYETLEKTETQTTDGTSVHYYCRNVEVRRQEITGEVAVTMAGIGGAFLVISLIILRILSLLVPASLKAQPVVEPSISGINMSVSGVDLPPETLETVRQALTSLVALKGQIADDDDTLAEKLEQLQEARDRGLITPEEYTTIRQAILDRMDD